MPITVELNIELQELPVYYYYHNWTANQLNKIHIGTCGFCRYGSGSHNNPPVNRGENGVWIGPFSTLQLCQDYVNDLGLPPNTCQVCI